MSLKASIGFGIGHDKLSLVHLTSTGKNIRVAAHAAYPLETNRAIPDVMGDLERILGDFIEENRIVGADIFGCVGRERAYLRFIELPLAVKENLRDSIGYELEKYTPFASGDVYFDFQIIEEDKENNRMKILLAVVRKDVVEPLFKPAGSGSSMFCGIEPSSSALANFCVAVFGEDQGPVGFLFAADGSSELNLLGSRRLVFSRSFADDLSGESAVEAWRSGLQSLLKTLGEQYGERDIPLLVSVADEDLRALERSPAPRGFALRVLDLDLFGLPSRDLIPACGAALKGLVDVPMEINLLPEAFRKKASRIGWYICGALLTLALLLGLTWVGGTIYHQKYYLESLERAQTELEGNVKRIKDIELEYRDLEARIEYLNALRRDDIQVLDVLAELTKIIPETAWLRRFNYSDRRVEIEGYANSASELIPLLEESPLFKDVTFLSGITKSREGKETFRIGMEVG